MGYIIGLGAVGVSIILIRKKINIGWVMLMNAVIIAVMTGMSWATAGQALYRGVMSSKTLSILLILTLILMIERIMRKSGMIARLVASVQGLMNGSPYSAVVLPIVIGMLPSPGGALFSCPMVEETVADRLPQQRKAFINYWFRHTWLEAFILYPAVILLSELVEVPVLDMFVRILPFMVLWVILGVWSAYRKVDVNALRQPRDQQMGVRHHGRDLVRSAYPIFIIVGIYLVLITVTNIPFALQISGALTVMILLIRKRYPLKKTFHTFRKSIRPQYILTVTGVMIFNEFIKASGLIENWLQVIYDHQIPIQLLYVALPIFAAVFAGIAVNYVALAFPFLLLAGIGGNLWDVTAAFICGVVGTMCTPVHLCSVMSADYFKVPVDKLLIKVFLTALPVLAVAIAIILL